MNKYLYYFCLLCNKKWEDLYEKEYGDCDSECEICGKDFSPYQGKKERDNFIKSQLKNIPYAVILSANPNPDFDSGHASEVYIPKKQVKINSWSDASKVCRLFIEKNELGGGNWTGGAVLNRDFEQIGRVSYNGRVWDKNESEIKIR